MLSRPLVPVLLFASLVSSVTAARADLFGVSDDKQRRLGNDAAKEIEQGAPIVSGPVEEWVQRVGERLVKVTKPDFQYDFHVIDSPQINAFCLPGGHVYVYTGLRKIVRTDDELAAILGHEITHAEEEHYAKQYTKSSKRSTILGIGSLLLGLPPLAQQAVGMVDFGLTQKYSREQESEADREGFFRMKRAGYDPHAMETVLKRLADEDDRDGLDKWMSDHPEGKKRVAQIDELLKENP